MYDESLLAQRGNPAYTPGTEKGLAHNRDTQEHAVKTKDKSFLARIFVPKTSAELIARNDQLMHERWGPSHGSTYDMVQRYWNSQRTGEHWRNLYQNEPKNFMKYLKKGYLEPIPLE